MADLSSINTELMELQRFMGSDRLRLSDKEEDLKRLEKALSDLGRNKSDFTDTKEICLEPECAANSLLGDNADDLDALKEDGLQPGFVSIPNEQISAAEETISEEIEIVQQEIADLKSSIASLETQHEELTEQKQEVKNQS